MGFVQKLGIAPIAIFASLVITGCGSQPQLEDSFDPLQLRLPLEQRLRFEMKAPVIVLGRVLEVRPSGTPAPSPGDPKILTQLTEMKIDVEQAIKGNIEKNPLDFIYFTSPNDLGAARYIPEVGQRRVYFLKRSGDSFRSMGDVTDYTINPATGSHVDGFCLGKEPGPCLAELLLTPGTGMDSKAFAQDLPSAESEAEIFSSEAVARDLLKKLTQNPDKAISGAARQLIADLKRTETR